MSKGIQNRRTPEWLVSSLEEFFGHRFKLDAAASKRDYLCPNWYGLEINSFNQSWADWTFCNPPFEHFGDWIFKAWFEADEHERHSILLGPTACSQYWFHRCVKQYTAYAPDCRISYDLPNGQPTHGADRDTMVYAFGPDFKNECPGFQILPIPLRDSMLLDKLWRG